MSEGLSSGPSEPGVPSHAGVTSNIEQRRFRAIAKELVGAALSAADPGAAVHRHLRRGGDQLEVTGHRFDLSRYKRIFVVGGGKAGAPMARAVEDVLGDRLTTGLINVKYGYTEPTRTIEINQAGHPIPDERGVTGARRMFELVQSATDEDLVICLISGGGSALMALPVVGITLADKRRLTDALLRSGATINELNTVRKHLSAMKGGQLARAAWPADAVALILSDVVGSPLDVIASGPTVPDSTTFRDAWSVIEQHGLVDDLPPSIANHLKVGCAGEIPETPKGGDAIFARCTNVVIASNEIAAHAVLDHARALGMNTLLLSTYIQGEAREVAQVFSAIACEIDRSGQPVRRPACVVAGGETTVTVRGHGMGGRNQELALAASSAIDGVRGACIVTIGTDGTDGPTDAAGAIADESTISRARALGLDPHRFLADNDSYHFFQRLGDLIVTGPTNTNVNDLTFILVF